MGGDFQSWNKPTSPFHTSMGFVLIYYKWLYPSPHPPSPPLPPLLSAVSLAPNLVPPLPNIALGIHFPSGTCTGKRLFPFCRQCRL
jgi:hypothetical protein